MTTSSQDHGRIGGDGVRELCTTLDEVREAIRELRLADGHALRTGDESRFDRAMASICQHENRIKHVLARARSGEAS